MLFRSGSTQALTERLFHEMGRADLITDPRFKTNRDRVANVEALDEIVGAWVRERNQADVIEQLVKAEVAVAPVSDFKDLAEDPHLVSRSVLAEIDDPELGKLRMPRVLPRLSETPGRIAHAGVHQLGSHNNEVYVQRLGLSAAELQSLKADGVI